MSATYREIIRYVRERFGFVAKTCWIADVLAAFGRTKRLAHNRIDPQQLACPCPAGKWHAIEQACRALGRIPG